MKPFYAQQLLLVGSNENRSLEPIAALQKGLAMYRVSPDTSTYYTIIYFILVVISSQLPLVNLVSGLLLQPPLNAGYVLAARKLHAGEAARMDDFWQGFQNIKPLIMWTLLTFGVALAVIVPIALLMGTTAFLAGSFSGGGVPTTALLVTFLAIAIVGLLAGPAFLVGFMLTLFADAAPLEALQGSIQVVKRYALQLWMLFILLAIINFLGTLCLVLGLLVSVPISFYAVYDAFVQMVGKEEQGDAVDSLLRHFNE